MKRVIISNSQFRMSKPGRDVTYAGGDDLAFDGFSGVPYNGVYMTGVQGMNVVSSGYANGVVWFGRNFLSPPTCLVHVIDPYHDGLSRDYSCASMYSPYDSAQIRYYLYNDHLEVGCAYSAQRAQWIYTPLFAYLICQV